MFQALSTDRLSLTPLTLQHLSAAHALWTQPLVRRYLWDDEIIDIGKAAEPLKTSEADFEAHRFGLWGVCWRGQTELSGFCGLRVGELFREPELLFGVADRWRGQGVGLESATGVLDYAFQQLGLARVGAATDPPNVDSQRLLARLGMRLVRGAGHGSTTLLYGLTREEWEDRQRSTGR